MAEQASKTVFFAWVKLGYAARGALYLIVGMLALLAALSEGGALVSVRETGTRILEQPLGQLLLGVLAFSLLGYSLWRLVQGATDAEDRGKSLGALAVRCGVLASALTHLALVAWIVALIIDTGTAGRFLSGTGVLTTAYGQLAIGIAGVAVVIGAVVQVHKAWSDRIGRHICLPSGHDGWALPLSRFGLTARALVWSIIGWFFINTAVTAREGKVRGLDDALALVSRSEYGPSLLAALSAGLLSFGLYSLLEACYRVFPR